MKKKTLFTFALILMTSLMFAQTDSSTTKLAEQIKETSGVVTEVVDGIERISGNVWKALEEIAKTLEVPAKHVYAVVIKQQIVKAITELIVWFLIPFTLTIFGYYWSVKKWEFFLEKNIKESEGISIVGGMIFIFVPLLFLIFGCDWNVIITGFVNPEFGALTDITEMVKTLTK